MPVGRGTGFQKLVPIYMERANRDTPPTKTSRSAHLPIKCVVDTLGGSVPVQNCTVQQFKTLRGQVCPSTRTSHDGCCEGTSQRTIRSWRSDCKSDLADLCGSRFQAANVIVISSNGWSIFKSCLQLAAG